MLDEVQPTRVILLGDVFNKGPDPQGTWALVKQWNAEVEHWIERVNFVARHCPESEISTLDETGS